MISVNTEDEQESDDKDKMGFSVLRCFEYVAECDLCGCMDVMHTGDCPIVNGQEIFVHNTRTAIKGFQFHQTKHGFICNSCYKHIRRKET